jgi:glycosyltransferase involved in cell wall biosynthesis
VCSNVGVNREVINHGKNGFLADSEEEWLNSLKNLIDNTKLRTELGLRARETVVNNYSMTRCAQIFTEVVHNTINLKKQNLAISLHE